MTVSRRKTLALLGGGMVAAAGGVGYAVTRTPQTALQPWDQAGQYADPRMRALSYALLAPNPHNMQPWLVDLTEPDAVVLRVDTTRLLPHTDPFSRQIVIGLGCFLELMVMAAAQDGFGVSLELFPEGMGQDALDGRPVAMARFLPGAAQPDPLFAHVMQRRSLKEPYDQSRPVADALLDALRQSVQRGSNVGATASPEGVADLRVLTRDALEVEFTTHRTMKESVDLFRIGHREVDANPDGLDFTGPMFEALRLTGQFNREVALDPGHPAFRQGLAMVRDTSMSGMAYVWLVSDDNARVSQIAAGRDWMRVDLACAAAGLGIHPMSQALQEYPEMDALYAEVHDMLAPGGGTVQMLGRLGYGPQVGRSPRWPLEAKIVDV